MTVTPPKTLEIEESGLERVTESERQHTTTRDSLWLWVGANLTAPTLTVGLLSVVFGLGLWGTVGVIVSFTLLGSAPVAYFSTWGPKTGLAQMVLSRYAFGLRGARFQAACNALLGMGFIALNAIVGESFLVTWSAGVIPPWLALAALLAVSTLVSLYGYFLLQRFERFIWLFMAIPLAVLLALAVPRASFSVQAAPAHLSTMAVFAAVATYGGVIFAHTGSWGPLASDFTRRMPAHSSGWRIFLYALLGLAGPCIALELVGALLVSLPDAGNPALLSSGPGLVVSRLLGNPFLSGVLVLAFTISVISNNVPACYGLVFSFQLIGLRRVPRPWLALLSGIVYFLLALLLAAHFSDAFEHVLLLVAYWLAAWMSISLLEHWMRRGHYPLDGYEDARQLPSGLTAHLAMVLGLFIASFGVSQTLYVGPLSRALGGADLGYPLGLLATGVIYYPLRRFERARERRQRTQVLPIVTRIPLETPVAWRERAVVAPDASFWSLDTLRLPARPMVSARIPMTTGESAGLKLPSLARGQPRGAPMQWSDVLKAVEEKKAGDLTVVNLTRGEPLPGDPAIYEAVDQAAALLSPALKQALLESYTAGWPPLLDVFRERLAQLWGREVMPAELVALPGITQTLKYLLEALRSRVTRLPGLANGPFRLLFPVGLEFPGMTDARNPLPPSAGPYLTEPLDQECFRICFPDPASLDWQDVGAVMLSQPHITGRLWTGAELLQLAEEAHAHGAICVVDAAEACPFAPLSREPAPLVDHPAVLHLFTLSKVGFPGLRVGVAVGHPALIDALRQLIEEQIILPDARAQHDAWAALCRLAQADAPSWFGERYADRWQSVVTALRTAGALDRLRRLAAWEGGPYAWYQWSAGPTSQEVFYRLLDVAHVAVCPAEALQLGDAAPIRAIRIGLGAVRAREAFEDALARLAPVLAVVTTPPTEPQISERTLRRQRAIHLILQGKR